MCCPQPSESVIAPVGIAAKCRNYIKYVTIGEVIVCILNMMIFDITSGFTHSISVWIDFMAYSTMHFCQTMILIFSGALDLGMLLFSWSRSDSYKAVINSHWLGRYGYWVIIAFYVAKIIVGCLSYAVFRKHFKVTHGHTDLCRAVPRGGHQQSENDAGFRRVSDPNDNERGVSRQPAFMGSGISIGSGG